MKHQPLEIPLDQLHNYTKELPWLAQLQTALQQDDVHLELTIGQSDGCYHLVRKDDRILITPVNVADDSSFMVFRGFHQYMMDRFRTHLEGLAHNLRGPISNIRSRSELTLQFFHGAESAPANPLLIRVEKALNRFLESSDQMNLQLKDLERLLRWMSPAESIEPLNIRAALETLNACFMTDLFYKRQVTCHIDTPEDLPLWTRSACLLVEPAYHMMNDAVSRIRSLERGEITWGGSMENGSLILRLMVHDSNQDRPSPTTLNDDETGSSFSPASGPGLPFAHWIAVQASGSFRVQSRPDALPVIMTLQLPVHP